MKTTGKYRACVPYVDEFKNVNGVTLKKTESGSVWEGNFIHPMGVGIHFFTPLPAWKTGIRISLRGTASSADYI